MMKFLLIIFLLINILQTCAAWPLQPAILTCEYIQNPLGINTKQPRFCWTFTATQRNQIQQAYELLVSDNLQNIQHLKGDVWATGKVVSDKNIQIVYNGVQLQSFKKYYWRVKVYNRSGEASAWSSINWFETAMFTNNDWQAKWISDGSLQPAKEKDFYKDDPMPVFRKIFSANKTVKQARLYISGLGYYEAFINGNKIGDHVLDPGFTTYKKQVEYVVYDITPNIKIGKNCIGVMSGNGWYNPLPLHLFGKFNLRDYLQTGRPCVKAEIHIEYNDGSIAIVATDSTWKTAPGPVVRNSVYLGEHYDARLELKGWNNAKINDSAWKNSVVIEGPSGSLTAQMQPAIKVTKVIKPISILPIAKDTFIADMGQNFAGVIKIKVQGKRGTKITFRYGEELYKNGRLNVMTSVCTQLKWNNGGPGAPPIAWQEDSYILKGGVEIWQPRFTFHGFRYVEITGWPGTPTINDITGLRMNSDVTQNGFFACSNPMFNQLHQAIQFTFLSNLFSIQSDCPAREKMGYGADIVVTSGAYLYNYNMANFYQKSVQDFANEQQPDGGITEIAPFTGIADKGYGGNSGPLGWELVFPYLQKQLYDFYGDERIIENNYEALQKQIIFLQSKAKENLFFQDISDHEALDAKPEAFTASAFYFHHALLAASFAGILHKTKDSVQYAALADTIKKAIIDSFYKQKGVFDNGTQSAQLFALWYHLSPDEDASFSKLKDAFANKNQHLSTGIFATKMMFDVLREKNRNNIVYTIANQKNFPGWGYMLANGATTLWESWAFSDNVYSQNHPMFGSVDEWFYRSLLGINSASPGFKKIVIKPQPAGNLAWAKGSYESIQGTITSDWKIENHLFILHVIIPANTSAEIWMPCKNKSAITENGKQKELVKYENEYAVVQTGSGDYLFTAEY